MKLLKQNTKNKKKGFTLVESLLYVGITGLVVFSITIFLSISLASQIKNQTIAEVEQEGLQIMQLITQTIRNADNITLPAPGNSDNSLTLDVFNTADDPTVFDLSGGIIRTKEGAGSFIPLTSGRIVASNLIFSNLSRTTTPGIVRIQFTLTHFNNSGRNEYDYSKTFYASASLR